VATKVNPATDAEIRRKAQLGIELDIKDPENLKLYDAYRKKYVDEVRRKAMAGDTVATPNAFGQKIYDDFRKGIDAEINRKAMAGDALTTPNAYNQKMYDDIVAQKKKNDGVGGVGSVSGESDAVGDVGKSNETTTPTTTSAQTPQNYIEGLSEAKRKAQMASLAQSRDQALSNLQAEKSGIAPKYYDARNQAAAGAQQSARNFAEFMAARGGTSSGANAQATLMNNMSLQGNLGALGRQEAEAFQDIARRETDARNAYSNNLAQAEAGILGERMNLLLNDYYRAQERGDRLTQQAIQNEFARAGLTGFLDGQRTLSGQSFDRGVLESDRNFNRGVFESDRGFERGVTESDRAFAYQQQQDQIANDNWNKQFMADITGTYIDANGNVQRTTAKQQQDLNNLWMASEQTGVIGAQLAEIYGLPPNTPTLAGKRLALDIQQTNAGINNAATSAAAQQKQNNINNALNVWEMTGKAPKGLEDYGVPEGTPYNPPQTKSSESGDSEKTEKEFSRSSAGVYGDMKFEFDNHEVLDKNGKPVLDKNGKPVKGMIRSEALEYLALMSDQLTESDYRALLELIDELPEERN